jgi:hypothetical protein
MEILRRTTQRTGRIDSLSEREKEVSRSRKSKVGTENEQERRKREGRISTRL